MADNVEITAGTGTTVAADEITGVKYQRVKICIGADGTAVDLAEAPLTDTELRATAVPVSLATAPTTAVTGPLTDTELRATAVPVSGTVTASGPLTDTQLRNTAVPVSLASVPSHAVTGPLTDTQLRATAVPVSLASAPTTAVTGPLTDTQLRAADVKITLDSEAVVLGAGSAAIGKLAANSGVDIGDVDVTSLPAHAASSETGSVYNGATALTPKFAPIAAASSGNNTVVAAVSGKKIRVLAVQLISSGTVNAKWQTAAGGTDLTGLAYLVANAGYVLPFNPVGWFETAAGALLNLNLSAAIAVGGSVTYVEV